MNTCVCVHALIDIYQHLHVCIHVYVHACMYVYTFCNLPPPPHIEVGLAGFAPPPY